MSTDQPQTNQSVPVLLAKLRDPDAKIRQQAVEALEEAGDSHAVEPLLAALEDSDTNVRVAAINTLTEIMPVSKLIQTQLVIALIDEKVDVRRAAATAISKVAPTIIRDGQRSQTISDGANLVAGISADPGARAGLTYVLGVSFVEQGRWYDGLRLLEKSLAIRRRFDDLGARADTIYQIARAHHLIGNLDKARTYYRDALRLYEHTGDQRGIADCKTGLGHLMTQTGSIEEAIGALKSARQIYRKLGNKQEASKVEEILQLATRVREQQLA